MNIYDAVAFSIFSLYNILLKVYESVIEWDMLILNEKSLGLDYPVCWSIN